MSKKNTNSLLLPTIPLSYNIFTLEEIESRSLQHYENMKKRRTVRDFSERHVPIEIIKNCIRTADTAPNGANQHPWHFVIISDKEKKRKIRIAAEKEEKKFYNGRATKEWLEAIAPLGTDYKKPFLEIAPHLIAVFAKNYEINRQGELIKNYYVNESVGIATGLLIGALHQSGLVSLTHTPSPMGFLNKILKRPKNERPFLLIVVGFPQENVKVPDIKRKSLGEIASYF